MKNVVQYNIVLLTEKGIFSEAPKVCAKTKQIDFFNYLCTDAETFSIGRQRQLSEICKRNCLPFYFKECTLFRQFVYDKFMHNLFYFILTKPNILRERDTIKQNLQFHDTLIQYFDPYYAFTCCCSAYESILST